MNLSARFPPSLFLLSIPQSQTSFNLFALPLPIVSSLAVSMSQSVSVATVSLHLCFCLLYYYKTRSRTYILSLSSNIRIHIHYLFQATFAYIHSPPSPSPYLEGLEHGLGMPLACDKFCKRNMHCVHHVTQNVGKRGKRRTVCRIG